MRCVSPATHHHGDLMRWKNTNASYELRLQGPDALEKHQRILRIETAAMHCERINASYFVAPTSSAMRILRSLTYSVFPTSDGAVHAM